MRKVWGALFVASAFVVGLAAGPASADITFTLGNNPEPDEENILFNCTSCVNGPALTVTGETNQSETLVDFTSDENLTTPAIGQAVVEAEDGGFDDLLITLNPTNPGTFLDFILNPVIVNPPGPGSTGEATVTVTDNLGGTWQFTYDLGTGENFLTIVAINDQSIQSILLESTVDIGLEEFASLKQPRISGIAGEGGGGSPIVPAPAAIVMLGSGLLALTAFARRKGK